MCHYYNGNESSLLLGFFFKIITILEYLRRLENIHWFGSIVSTRELQ